MYPNNGYYGQPYPSGNPYMMGTTQYSSPQSQMQHPPFNPTNVQQRSYQPQQAVQISGRVVQNENEITPQEVPMDGAAWWSKSTRDSNDFHSFCSKFS